VCVCDAVLTRYCWSRGHRGGARGREAAEEDVTRHCWPRGWRGGARGCEAVEEDVTRHCWSRGCRGGARGREAVRPSDVTQNNKCQFINTNISAHWRGLLPVMGILSIAESQGEPPPDG